MKKMNYPKPVLIGSKVVEPNPIEIKLKDLIRIDDLEDFVCIRESGEFEDMGIYLVSYYNWQIVEDSEGKTVLIPTKK